MNEITAEQIAQHYSAAMDSVNLINQRIHYRRGSNDC